MAATKTATKSIQPSALVRNLAEAKHGVEFSRHALWKGAPNRAKDFGIALVLRPCSYPPSSVIPRDDPLNPVVSGSYTLCTPPKGVLT
jgi:hypothetical protein